MRICRLCKKKDRNGTGSFFTVPKDERRRNKWSEICQVNFTDSAFVCMDHFAPSDIVKSARKTFLMPSAVPSVDIIANTKPVIATTENSENIGFENQNEEFTKNFVNSNKFVMPLPLQEEHIMQTPVMPPQLQEESILETAVSKSLFCSGFTQTNTRLCGLVETLELSEELRLNCFYCSEAFPLEKWKDFANHLKAKHFAIKEGLKTCEYLSEDHDWSSSLDLMPSSPPESKSELPLLVDPLESTNLSCCLKTFDVAEEELEVKEECDLDSIEIVRQKPTEIVFEYTPRDIVDSLLDSMKNYPVLWQFDENPFNEEFNEAVEDLCKIINDKWSLNINNLKMRRSINRILRFYCYLYPNDNIENIDQFTCYYDKCATFLPTSVNEIAYARCSHCYICYRNDFDLKRHLLEEYKNLQWPYKCVQCKECFIESDEYEFHKCLSHYDEIFRCEPCNKTFFRRNVYNKHVSDKHPREAKYKCDVCEKVFKNRNYLRNHKLIHGEKKHKCHLCPKSFCDKTRLSLHLKLHRRQYDLMCEICGQKLFNKASLRVHMKKHTQEKITCNICNLKLRKSSLKRHLTLLHVAYEGTIEQTLKGRHVNYRRLAKSSPFRQRRQYSEKNYDCKICKMSFENYELVLEHNEEFHPDIPKWSCEMCAMDFSLKKNLKRHYRRRHKLEAIQVYKLVEENEDLNAVLAYDKEHLDKLSKAHCSKPKPDSARKSVINGSANSDLLTDAIYFVKDNDNSLIIEDDVMTADDDIETQDDYLIEFLEEES